MKAWTTDRIALALSYDEARALLRTLPARHPLKARIREDVAPKTVWVCSDCGSPDVDMEAWVKFNGGADPGGDPPGGTFCNHCDVNDVEVVSWPRDALRMYDGEWLAFLPAADGIPTLVPVFAAGLFACVDEDGVLMHCPMFADDTPDRANYGPVEIESCERSTLQAIDAVLKTHYAEKTTAPTRRARA